MADLTRCCPACGQTLPATAASGARPGPRSPDEIDVALAAKALAVARQYPLTTYVIPRPSLGSKEL